MPPKCPECGRFLSNDFIQGLLAEPAPCPRCSTVLSAEHFHGTAALQRAPEPLAESVRPPDLPPDVVRDGGSDPLQGWDESPVRPAPGPAPEVATIVAAGLLGGLVGALLIWRRRSWGAALGTIVGAVFAIARTRGEDPWTPAP